MYYLQSTPKFDLLRTLALYEYSVYTRGRVGMVNLWMSNSGHPIRLTSREDTDTTKLCVFALQLQEVMKSIPETIDALTAAEMDKSGFAVVRARKMAEKIKEDCLAIEDEISTIKVGPLCSKRKEYYRAIRDQERRTKDLAYQMLRIGEELDLDYNLVPRYGTEHLELEDNIPPVVFREDVEMVKRILDTQRLDLPVCGLIIPIWPK